MCVWKLFTVPWSFLLVWWKHSSHICFWLRGFSDTKVQLFLPLMQHFAWLCSKWVSPSAPTSLESYDVMCVLKIIPCLVFLMTFLLAITACWGTFPEQFQTTFHSRSSWMPFSYHKLRINHLMLLLLIPNWLCSWAKIGPEKWRDPHLFLFSSTKWKKFSLTLVLVSLFGISVILYQTQGESLFILILGVPRRLQTLAFLSSESSDRVKVFSDLSL